MNLRIYRRHVDRQLTKYKGAKESVNAEKLALKKAEKKHAASLEAQGIVQAIAQTLQQQAHQRIAAVVTKCLAAVFDCPYEFQIRFDRKRGKTEAKMVFVRDGQEVDPIDASGGGVVDVASFALRVARIVASKPPGRRLLVMDEPFKFLAAEYRPRVRMMLEQLSTDLDFQFIYVTHIPELETGTVVHI